MRTELASEIEKDPETTMEECAVRLAIRIRPVVTEEPDIFEKKDNVLLCGDRFFHFDKVFGKKCTQETVYKDLVRFQVGKLIDGFSGVSLGKSR